MSQAIFLQWALTVRCFLEFWRYFYEWMDPSKRQRERNRGQRTWQLASLIQLLGVFYLWCTGTASGSHCSRVLWRTAPTHPTHFFFHKREPSWCLHTMIMFERWGADAQVNRVTLSRAGRTAYCGNRDMHLQFLTPTKANIWYSHHYFFRILGKDCIRYLLSDLNVEDCYPWAPFSHGTGNIASFIGLIEWWLYVILGSQHLPPSHPPSFPSA